MDEIQRRAEEALAMLEPNQNRQRTSSCQLTSGSLLTSNTRQRSSSDIISSAQVANSSHQSHGCNVPHGSQSGPQLVNRVSWRRVGNRIPVHRLASDASELTAEEMARFHNLIPTSRPWCLFYFYLIECYVQFSTGEKDPKPSLFTVGWDFPYNF